MKPYIIETIVNNNLCIGCGLCAGLCPANALRMEFNKYGEYNPVEITGCLKNCNLCLQICPFSENEENEGLLAKEIFSNTDGIKHRPETGYYLDSYVGYSNINNHRANGASGGMATWILETLLKNNIVDHILCVTPNENPEKLFRFAVFANIDSIRHSAKSAYYPVEMSEVIKQIIKNESRYAIIGLPCFIKGLRLAQKKNNKLRNRIIVTIGLVCGQLKSKCYTRYLAELSGIHGELKEVCFRGKDSDKPSSNFYFYSKNKNNNYNKIFFYEGIGKVWNNRWFTLRACNFCDDVFAEMADVTVMDAWLPEYIEDSKGTNLIIVRSPLVHNLIKLATKENQIKIEHISINKVILAESGVLNIKRNQLAYRLYLAKQAGLIIPTKSVTPSRKISFLNKKEIELKDKMQRLSKELFLLYFNGERADLTAFSKKIGNFVSKLEKWKHIARILRLPMRIIKKARRILLGV